MTAATFFATPEDLRAWFSRHAAVETVLIVGFHKVGSGRASITWPEAVDEALCVGWIDGVRQRIDEHSYRIRFTPRRAGSTWSAVNIERVRVLNEAGRMQPAGAQAFARRSDKKSRTYAYEQPTAAVLAADDERAFRRSRAAWAYFEQQPPGYRQRMLWWVANAKQEATRRRRLAALVEACREQRRL